jgi:acyl carrier protein phosphodiesterase
MNFLAHAYLSFENPQFLAGNMISDFVKGAQKNNFPRDVRQGIQLHRDIDSFTDAHPALQEAKNIFRPHYRLYSSAIVDVLLDHFLANDPTEFTLPRLMEFTQATYASLQNQASLLPPTFLRVFGYMQAENWLYGYHTREGMARSLRGLARRAAYLEESETAFRLFESQYDLLGEIYGRFFPDVKLYAKGRYETLAA